MPDADPASSKAVTPAPTKDDVGIDSGRSPVIKKRFRTPCIYKKALIVDTEEEVSQIADRLPFGS
jgi:hypothetical protein